MTDPFPAAAGGHGQADDILQILEEFSVAAQLRFDRTLAARGLGEAERAIPGDDAVTWARRMVEVGESIDLRVQLLECTLQEALAFVRQGMPIATAIEQANGVLRWVLVCEVRGRRARVRDFQSAASDRWVSVKSLRQQVAERASDERRSWVVGQSALAWQGAADSAHGHGDSHAVSPLGRLLAFSLPEKKDLWVILIFSIIDGVLLLATPIAVEALVNTVAFGRYLQPIVVLAILLLTFLTFAAALRGLLSYVVEILQRRFFVRLVADLAYRLPRVRGTAFDRVHGPELVNRFFEIATVQKAVSSLLLGAVSIILQTLVGMAVLAFYHPFLLGFDLVLLLLIAFITFGLGRGAVKTAVRESRAKYAVGEWLEELVRHPTAFKLHSGHQFALDRSDRLTVEYLEARKKHYRIVLRQLLFALGLQATVATALLGLGGWLVIQGQLTLGQLVAAELIVTVIVGSFAKMGKHLESFYDLLASMDKLGHLFDLPTERHDKQFHLQAGGPAEVAVRQVSYSYGEQDSHEHEVLHGVSLEIKPGQCVALTGPSGSGKSTLIDLLSGVRQPGSGHLELDGIDLRELRADSLREHLAVARAVEIFRGTIDENVHLNRPHISAQDVREALAAVGLVDEVLRLPDGLNAMLQTNGAPLSTTQALRLMLARAIVGRPRLLLIDGTLDALPDEMQRAMLASLLGPDRPWTALIATGRRAVIDRCDQFVTLGKIAAPAKHEDDDSFG
jgi:ABC-type bacteriocin/lantibiotic exporter with double-glycine peptidase domain